MVTFGDMAEALYQLRKRYGLYYNPSEQEIFEYAKLNMQKMKPKTKILKDLGYEDEIT